MAKHGRYFAGTVLTRSRRVLPWESGSLRRVRKEGCLVLFRGPRRRRIRASEMARVLSW